MNTGKAVQIVTFDVQHFKPRIDYAAVERIVTSRDGTQSLSTIVICIGGVARSGKSFLLNLFVAYLSSLERNESGAEWEKSECVIRGVNWAQSKTSVTLGIWMWSRPFVITRRDGSKAVVLLVDSQGTGDNRRSDTRLDTLLMYMSLQISSVQLLNVKSYLTSNEMISLQLCADYADIASSAENKNPYLFQSLMFVIRDYQDDETNFGEDSKIFGELMQSCMNPELSTVIRGIQSAFKTVSSYNLPYPGQNISTASSADEWKVKDVPKLFTSLAKNLIRKITGMDGKWCGSWNSTRELLINIKSLKYQLENADLPAISSPADALQEAILYRAFNASQVLFSQAVAELCKPEKLKSCQTEGDLKEIFNKISAELWRNFKKTARSEKYAGTKIWIKYKGMLNSLIHVAYARIKASYEWSKKVAELEKEQNGLRQQESRFESEVNDLVNIINDMKRQQAESEELSRVREESLKIEIERLQRATAEIKNSVESQRLQKQIQQYEEDNEMIQAESMAITWDYNRQLALRQSQMSEAQIQGRRDYEKRRLEMHQLNLAIALATKERENNELEAETRSEEYLGVFFGCLEAGCIIGTATGAPFGALIGAAVGAVAGGIACLVNKLFSN